MERRISESGEELCTVCSEILHKFAYGECDHPICYRCSTRMRILCKQMYCAICRSDLPKVLFTTSHVKYKNATYSKWLHDAAANIYFENSELQEAFYKLQESVCSKCSPTVKFNHFLQFRTHMKKEHGLFPCDLCTEHVQLFPTDRRFYDRTALAEHKRKGDRDDKSHKGHPLCKFCDVRYFDNDQLVIHLRKDHFYCHLCHRAGTTNEFYHTYATLLDHFRDKHFVCEDCNEAGVQFTNIYDGDLDLKAHIAATHGKNLKKSLARASRTLQVEFNLAPRPKARGSRHEGGYGSGRDKKNFDKEDNKADKTVTEDPALYRALQASLRTVPPPESSQAAPIAEDFPWLDGSGPSPAVSQNLNTAPVSHAIAMSNNLSVRHGSLTRNDFPALGVKKTGANSASAWSSTMTAGREGRNFPSLAESMGKNSVPSQSGATGVASVWGKGNETAKGAKKNKAKQSSSSAASKLPSRAEDFPLLGQSLQAAKEWGPKKQHEANNETSVRQEQSSMVTLHKHKRDKNDRSDSAAAANVLDDSNALTLKALGEIILQFDNNKIEHKPTIAASVSARTEHDESMEVTLASRMQVNETLEVNKTRSYKKQLTENVEVSKGHSSKKHFNEKTEAPKAHTFKKHLNENVEVNTAPPYNKHFNENVEVNKTPSYKKHLNENVEANKAAPYKKHLNENVEAKKAAPYKKHLSENVEANKAAPYKKHLNESVEANKAAPYKKHLNENVEVSTLENGAAGYSSKPTTMQRNACKTDKAADKTEEVDQDPREARSEITERKLTNDVSELFSEVDTRPVAVACGTIENTLTSICLPTTVTEFTMEAGDFPSLPITKPAPGFKPPPGFMERRPPGLNGVPKCWSATPCMYTPVENSAERTEVLMSRICDQLRTGFDSGDIRNCSLNFQQGYLPAEKYLDLLEGLLGQEGLQSHLLELIALLPDIDKQQKLARAAGVQEKMTLCQKCHQMLMPLDVQYHQVMHEISTVLT